MQYSLTDYEGPSVYYLIRWHNSVTHLDASPLWFESMIRSLAKRRGQLDRRGGNPQGPYKHSVASGWPEGHKFFAELIDVEPMLRGSRCSPPQTHAGTGVGVDLIRSSVMMAGLI